MKSVTIRLFRDQKHPFGVDLDEIKVNAVYVLHNFRVALNVLNAFTTLIHHCLPVGSVGVMLGAEVGGTAGIYKVLMFLISVMIHNGIAIH